MKLLITGGHLAPALAAIDYLKKNNPEVEVIFVGRQFAQDGDSTISLEFKEITGRKINFFPIVTGRLTRIFSLKSFISLFKIPVGFFQAFKIISQEKPDVILSFGSYIALPMAVVGFLFKIPVYTHEQTICPGLANRMIAFFARKVFCAFIESFPFFPRNKVILTGNPVRESMFQIRNQIFQIEKNRPVIYFTGGTLGSHSINLHVKKILPQLLKKFIVIHQTGDTKEYRDFEMLEKIKKENYYLAKHFFDGEISYIYSLADLVVGRAGANTFFDLMALKKPALFIPLPWSANQEQLKQAEIFKKDGVGEIFSQSDESKNLFVLIEKMINNLNKYKNNFNNLKFIYKENASALIFKEIFSIQS